MSLDAEPRGALGNFGGSLSSHVFCSLATIDRAGHFRWSHTPVSRHVFTKSAAYLSQKVAKARVATYAA